MARKEDDRTRSSRTELDVLVGEIVTLNRAN